MATTVIIVGAGLLFGMLILASYFVERDTGRCPVCHKPTRNCRCGFNH